MKKPLLVLAMAACFALTACTDPQAKRAELIQEFTQALEQGDKERVEKMIEEATNSGDLELRKEMGRLQARKFFDVKGKDLSAAFK